MARLLSAYEGASFIVVESNGDISEGQEAGLYHQDTRFLSRHTLRVGGAAPLVLSSRAPAAHMLVVFSTNPAIVGVPRGSLLVRRSYAVGSGLHCDIDIQSYAPQALEVDLELSFDADFADVFEVKRLLESPEPSPNEPAIARTVGRAALAIARGAGEGWSRRTEVRFSLRPEFDGKSARFRVSLAPRERFHLCQDVFTIAGGDFAPPRHACSGLLALEEEMAPAAPICPPAERPVLRSGDAVLDDAFAQSIDDLYALRVHPPESSLEDFHLAAGVPWYMALFGRDSLIAASQAMPYMPDLARGVLRSLARWQGKKDDPETEEQPGKILHEYRPPGLAGARRFVSRFPYYGTADATSLFVMILGEYWVRTGDLAFVRALEKNLTAAVAWIERACDADRDGFITYRRSTPHGLWNQGWKDSEDSVRFRGGAQANPPIALVEVQGYACAALRSAGELYRALGRPSRTPRRSRPARRGCARRSTPRSGCRSEASGRWRATAKGGRSTRSRRTARTCSGRAPRCQTARAARPTRCSATRCSRASAFARWAAQRARSARSRTTTDRSGRTTRRSRRWGSPDTGWATRPRASRPR